MSRPGHQNSSFVLAGYLDDQEFVRFDNDAASARVEPRARWVEQEGPEYWARETRIAGNNARVYAERLDILLGYYNQSRNGG